MIGICNQIQALDVKGYDAVIHGNCGRAITFCTKDQTKPAPNEKRIAFATGLGTKPGLTKSVTLSAMPSAFSFLAGVQV